MVQTSGRAPHGARGLKRFDRDRRLALSGRAPYGARGLKHKVNGFRRVYGCRAPHGARGLKRRPLYGIGIRRWSRPARGAWIETTSVCTPKEADHVAPRTGRVD